PWRDALAVTTRHPSPPALKNWFTAVCNATFCPRTIITIPTDQLTARTRGKSGSFTRKRSLTAVDLSSRLSRRIIASFLHHCLSLLPSPLWCYRTLNFLPLPNMGTGNLLEGRIFENTATTVVVQDGVGAPGNQAHVTQFNNDPCP